MNRNTVAKFFLVSLTVAVLASCAGRRENRDISSSSFPASTTEACRRFMNKLPKPFHSDFIEVPENWNRPYGEKIKVFFYWNEMPNLKPVVFFNGGPAGASHTSFAKFGKRVELDKLPFVFIDQRGTGCSDPYPADRSRVSLYGTVSIVKDAEAIREKIFGKTGKWNVMGHSFGGRIARRYIEVAPENLMRVFSYGYSAARSPDRAKERMLAQKRSLDDYLKTYPDQVEFLAKLRKQLDQDKPCFKNSVLEVCGSTIIDSVAIRLAFRDSFKEIRDTLLSLTLPNGQINQRNLQTFGNDQVGTSDDSVALTIISIQESSIEPFDAKDLWGVRRATASLRKDGQNPDSWLLNEARWTMAENSIEKNAAQAGNLHDPLDFKRIRANLQSSKGLEFVVSAGEQDSTNPPVTFATELRHYGTNVTFKIYPKLGHEGAYTKEVLKDVFPEYF